MQMPHLPRQVRQRAPVDDSALSPRAADRLEKLENISRRTACRWRKARKLHGPRRTRAAKHPPRPQAAGAPGGAGGRRPAQTRHPFMGARPLRVLLAREGTALSRGAVGRIVRHCLERRLIRPVARLRGRAGPRERRDFSDGYAQRRKYGARARNPGELVQIDRMTVHRDGQTLEEFRRTSQSAPSDPVTRFPGRPGVLARHREQCQALPRRGRGRHAVPPAVDPGRRRLGVHGPIRAALRRTRTAPARPAAQAPPVERPRRTLQRHAAPSVPGSSRRRTRRRLRRRLVGRAPALAQPRKAPFRS